jgi:hypothetical protein
VFSSISRRVTYANVAATLALFLSLSGGALAARHYLITSKNQISPKVLHKLKGKPGKPGKAGPAGAPGAPGPAGAAGSARAYALVVVNGPGNPILTESAGFTAVSEPQVGTFCVDPIIPGHPPLVSAAGVDATFVTVSPQQCPGGYEFKSNIEISGGGGFSVMVP